MMPLARLALRVIAGSCLMLALAAGCSGPAAEPSPEPPAPEQAPPAPEGPAAPAPTFTAEGALQVLPGARDDDTAPAATADVLLAEHLRGLKATPILAAALERAGDARGIYVGPDAAKQLAEDLRIKAMPDTLEIRVSLRGPDGAEAAAIVRQVMATYVAEYARDPAAALAIERHELEAAARSFDEQAEMLAAEMARLLDSRPIDGTGPPEARLAALGRQLADVQAELGRATAASATFAQAVQQAAAQGDMTPVLLAQPDLAEAVRSDPTLAAMTAEVAALQQELDGLRGGPAEEVARVSALLQAAQNAQQARQSELLGQLVRQLAAALAAGVDRLRMADADLTKRVADARAAADAEAKYRAMEQEYRSLQGRIVSIRDELERLKMAALLKRPQVQVKAWPEVPTLPDPPAAPQK